MEDSAESNFNPISQGCGPHSQISIHISPTTGGDFHLTVDPDITVDNLKKLISKRLKVPRDRICLLFRDKQLQEGNLLQHGITDGSKVTLLPNVETGLVHEPAAQPQPRNENVAPPFQEVHNDVVQAQPQAEELDVEQLNFALQQANIRIYNLEDSLKKKSYDRDGFEGNDVKTAFFTGLKSFHLLENTFNFIKNELSEVNTALTAFQQLTLTLMKLRRNYSFTDIAYTYNVNRRTVSRTFYKCLNVLYYKLNWLVYWPTKEELISTMPESFKSTFGNKVTTIIDCFEVPIEKSSNPNAASSMFSHYKQHQTIKFLIGISPQGTIMFISEGYGGKASDKMITDTSAFLENLSAGDLVLADRGFLIKEMVNNYLADVQTPAFKKGKAQMSPQDVEASRKLSSVRVHVERVIGCLKQKYTVFHSTMSMDVIKNMYTDNIPVVDKMVTVCCALYNLNPSVVPNC